MEVIENMFVGCKFKLRNNTNEKLELEFDIFLKISKLTMSFEAGITVM